VKVSVAIALRDRQEVVGLDLPGQPTVADAVSAAVLGERFASLDLSACRYGVWGREVAREVKLREGDRVEVLRPLLADPKASRRQRVARERGREG